jgi:hypothetical protein
VKGGAATGGEQSDKCRHRYSFEGKPAELYRPWLLAEAREQVKRHFSDRRIDGHRVVCPIDLRKDRLVLERSQRGVGGDISIGVESLRLHPAVPDVAVDVGRVQRWLEQQRQSQASGNRDHD